MWTIFSKLTNEPPLRCTGVGNIVKKLLDRNLFNITEKKGEPSDVEM